MSNQHTISCTQQLKEMAVFGVGVLFCCAVAFVLALCVRGLGQ